MSRRLIVLAVVMMTVAVVLAVRRPWERQPPQQPAPQQPYAITSDDLAKLNPANMVTLRCIIPGGDDRSVTILGGSGGNIDRTNFHLKDKEAREFTKKASGPFTIATVTVERGGQSHKQELNITIPAGQTREIRIKPDDTVEIVDVPK
jgi:hypothetical protein